MYVTINDVIGEKTIDLSHSIRNFDSRKEVAVISMFSANLRYEIAEPGYTGYESGPTQLRKKIPSGVYVRSEIVRFLGGEVELNQFVKDDQVTTRHKLSGITEMNFILNELDNTDNLENGRPSNTLLTYHVTHSEDFTSYEPHSPQYKRLKSGEITSLTLRITDQNDDAIVNRPGTSVVLHVR